MKPKKMQKKIYRKVPVDYQFQNIKNSVLTTTLIIRYVIPFHLMMSIEKHSIYMYRVKNKKGYQRLKRV